jgi:hypothetical protein
MSDEHEDITQAEAARVAEDTLKPDARVVVGTDNVYDWLTSEHDDVSPEQAARIAAEITGEGDDVDAGRLANEILGDT